MAGNFLVIALIEKAFSCYNEKVKFLVFVCAAFCFLALFAFAGTLQTTGRMRTGRPIFQSFPGSPSGSVSPLLSRQAKSAKNVRSKTQRKAFAVSPQKGGARFEKERSPYYFLGIAFIVIVCLGVLGIYGWRKQKLEEEEEW